jgi:hypothetical protein
MAGMTQKRQDAESAPYQNVENPSSQKENSAASKVVPKKLPEMPHKLSNRLAAQAMRDEMESALKGKYLPYTAVTVALSAEGYQKENLMIPILPPEVSSNINSLNVGQTFDVPLQGEYKEGAFSETGRTMRCRVTEKYTDNGRPYVRFAQAEYAEIRQADLTFVPSQSGVLERMQSSAQKSNAELVNVAQRVGEPNYRDAVVFNVPKTAGDIFIMSLYPNAVVKKGGPRDSDIAPIIAPAVQELAEFFSSVEYLKSIQQKYEGKWVEAGRGPETSGMIPKGLIDDLVLQGEAVRKSLVDGIRLAAEMQVKSRRDGMYENGAALGGVPVGIIALPVGAVLDGLAWVGRATGVSSREKFQMSTKDALDVASGKAFSDVQAVRKDEYARALKDLAPFISAARNYAHSYSRTAETLMGFEDIHALHSQELKKAGNGRAAKAEAEFNYCLRYSLLGVSLDKFMAEISDSRKGLEGASLPYVSSGITYMEFTASQRQYAVALGADIQIMLALLAYPLGAGKALNVKFMQWVAPRAAPLIGRAAPWLGKYGWKGAEFMLNHAFSPSVLAKNLFFGVEFQAGMGALGIGSPLVSKYNLWVEGKGSFWGVASEAFGAWKDMTKYNLAFGGAIAGIGSAFSGAGRLYRWGSAALKGARLGEGELEAIISNGKDVAALTPEKWANVVLTLRMRSNALKAMALLEEYGLKVEPAKVLKLLGSGKTTPGEVATVLGKELGAAGKGAKEITVISENFAAFSNEGISAGKAALEAALKIPVSQRAAMLENTVGETLLADVFPGGATSRAARSLYLTYQRNYGTSLGRVAALGAQATYAIHAYGEVKEGEMQLQKARQKEMDELARQAEGFKLEIAKNMAEFFKAPSDYQKAYIKRDGAGKISVDEALFSERILMDGLGEGMYGKIALQAIKGDRGRSDALGSMLLQAQKTGDTAAVGMLSSLIERASSEEDNPLISGMFSPNRGDLYLSEKYAQLVNSSINYLLACSLRDGMASRQR